MNIQYDVTLQSVSRDGKARSEYTCAFVDFLNSKHETMLLEFNTTDEAKTACYSIRQYAYRYDLNNKFLMAKRKNILYLVKKEG